MAMTASSSPWWTRAPDSIGSGIFRLDNGQLTRVVSLPSGSWLNGIGVPQGPPLHRRQRRRHRRDRVGDGVAAPAAPWFQTGCWPHRTRCRPLASAPTGWPSRETRLHGRVGRRPRRPRAPAARRHGGHAERALQEPQLQTGDGIAFDILGRLWIAVNGSAATPSGGLYRVAANGPSRKSRRTLAGSTTRPRRSSAGLRRAT